MLINHYIIRLDGSDESDEPTSQRVLSSSSGSSRQRRGRGTASSTKGGQSLCAV